MDSIADRSGKRKKIGCGASAWQGRGRGGITNQGFQVGKMHVNHLKFVSKVLSGFSTMQFNLAFRYVAASTMIFLLTIKCMFSISIFFLPLGWWKLKMHALS